MQIFSFLALTSEDFFFFNYWSIIASLTQWTWVWANSGRWWRTKKPGVLQSMGLPRVGHDRVTEQQQWLLDSVVLVSAIQWSGPAGCVHPPHPTPPGHPWAPSGAPCAVQQFPSSCVTPGCVYMSVLVAQFVPPSHPHICSLHLHFSSCPASRFICTIFLDSTCMC